MSVKKKNGKPYLDYVLKEQEWLKEHQEQELKEIRSKDGLTLRAAYIPRENAKRNYYLHARLPFNKRYRIRTGSPISMESWIQHSSSMAEKPRKKRRTLYYLWSERTP